jgi:hypothetical protein
MFLYNLTTFDLIATNTAVIEALRTWIASENQAVCDLLLESIPAQIPTKTFGHRQIPDSHAA